MTNSDSVTRKYENMNIRHSEVVILKRAVVQLQGNYYEQWAFRKTKKKRKKVMSKEGGS